jgi:exodeoxyribonuclease-3
MNGFKRNLGLRIDHILLSAELAKTCKSCSIDLDFRAKERPSDHAPVIAEIGLPEDWPQRTQGTQNEGA